MPQEFSDLEAKYDSFYAPAFEIEIDGGRTFSTAEGQASSVRVNTAIERANRVSFSVSGVFDRIAGDFTGLAEQGLEVGRDLSVKLGYGSELQPVMKGEISAVKPTFPEGGQPTVDVVGHGYRYQMDRTTRDDSWNESDLESVAEQIAKRNGFRDVVIGDDGPPTSTDAAFEPKQLLQDAESDVEFLWRLVREFDYELFSRAGVLRFRRSKKAGDAAVALTYGTGLRSFRVGETGGDGNVGTVTHMGVNHYTGEAVEGSSRRPEGGDEVVLKKAAMESNEEAEQRSRSKSTEIDRQRQSTATTIGLPDLHVGDWVQLDGLGSVGERSFDGKYYITAVDHDLGSSGYTTTVTLSGPTETTT